MDTHERALLSRASALLTALDLFTKLEHVQRTGHIKCNECAYCKELRTAISETVLQIEELKKSQLISH